MSTILEIYCRAKAKYPTWSGGYSTFNSYTNIASIRKGSLVIISASNSGGLEDDILKIQKDVKILTIIYNSDKLRSQITGQVRKVLINIESVFKNLIAHGHKIDQFQVEDCAYCNSNSIPVLVKGEQFIPSEVVIQEVLFKKNLVVDWIQKAIKNFAGKNVIIVNRADRIGEKIREIYLNIEPCIPSIDADDFGSRLIKHIRNFAPASIKYLVYAEDSSSKVLAEKIKDYLLHPDHFSQIELYPFVDINQITDKNTEATILVVTSCISNGNRLNSISRNLRVYEKASIHYLIGVAKLPSEDALRILIANLEFRQSGNAVNKVYILSEIFLPNNNSKRFKKYEKSPWIEELSYLENTNLSFYQELINERIETIENASGLAENLFY